MTLADCKITTYGDGPLCVDVRFDSKAQLDDLIEALSLLRDATDFDHVHLQDAPMDGKQSSASTEIVFHMPGSCFDSIRSEMIAHAERRIETNLRSSKVNSSPPDHNRSAAEMAAGKITEHH